MSTPQCCLEHANLTVRNLDEAVRFLTTAFPHFEVRGRGTSNGRPWLHIGSETTYIAFNEATLKDSDREPCDESGFNHLGFVVDDADLIANALRDAGYREGIQAEPHPHRKRRYFYDTDGTEWEFVEYLSETSDERNDYLL